MIEVCLLIMEKVLRRSRSRTWIWLSSVKQLVGTTTQLVELPFSGVGEASASTPRGPTFVRVDSASERHRFNTREKIQCLKKAKIM